MSYDKVTCFQCLWKCWDCERRATVSHYSATRKVEGHSATFTQTESGLPVFVFRGSQSISDFVSDAEAWQRSYPGLPGRIHSGFVSIFDEFKPWMLNELNKAALAGDAVYFTGHSLGGALATITSQWFGSTLPVYTFGSPRVGDSTFATAYRPKQFRVVHAGDPVPLVPAGFGYTHVGEEVRVGTSVHLSTLLTDPFANHHIERYVDALS